MAPVALTCVAEMSSCWLLSAQLAIKISLNTPIQAAEYAADKLHTYIQKHPMFKSDCKRAVLEACAQVDDEFVELARKKNIYDGTTAVIALLIKSRAIIATIGDSYCVRTFIETLVLPSLWSCSRKL